MTFEIVKLANLSGRKATIYSAIVGDNSQTLLDQFFLENRLVHVEEVAHIRAQIQTIAHKTGAIETFFTKYEGIKVGEDVYALYRHNLRLYCFRIGKSIVLLGGGGWKEVAKWQDDPKLSQEVNYVRQMAKMIDQRIRDRDIRWNGIELEGDFLFEDEDSD
jgi:hypothetical protein